MTELNQLKLTLIAMECNFTSCQTLVGYNVIISTDTKEMHFEFNKNGSFVRLV